jgi:HSP20 family protein
MDAGNIFQRIKNAVVRAGDQIRSDDAIVKRDGSSLENMDDRSLATPAMDVFENEKEYLFKFDVPGATPKHTDVHVSDDRVLTVHMKADGGKGRAAIFGDPGQSDWYRAIRLTPSAAGDKASSSVKNGILTVRIPKAEAPRAKVIPVTAEK